MSIDPVIFVALIVMSFGIGMSFAANLISYFQTKERLRD